MTQTHEGKTLSDALFSLPGTHEKIAALFREQGVTGARLKVCLCPVANFLSRETGSSVAVGSRYAECFGDETLVDLPFAVSHFVNLFDSGEYPELVDDQL